MFIAVVKCQGTKTIVKLWKGYESLPSYFELCGWGTKTFKNIILSCQNLFPDISGSQKLF